MKMCPVCAQNGLQTPIRGSSLCRTHYHQERRLMEALERKEVDDDLLTRAAASSQAIVARELGITRQAMKHRMDAANERRLRLIAAGLVEENV